MFFFFPAIVWSIHIQREKINLKKKDHSYMSIYDDGIKNNGHLKYDNLKY